DNDVNLEPDELGRDLRGALCASLRPAILDRNGATLDPTAFAQSLHKSSNPFAQAESVLVNPKSRWSGASPPVARAPRAATRPQRRRAWLRIFVVRYGVPCDPPVGGHSCNGGMIPSFHRAVCERAIGRSYGCSRRPLGSKSVFAVVRCMTAFPPRT